MLESLGLRPLQTTEAVLILLAIGFVWYVRHLIRKYRRRRAERDAVWATLEPVPPNLAPWMEADAQVLGVKLEDVRLNDLPIGILSRFSEDRRMVLSRAALHSVDPPVLRVHFIREWAAAKATSNPYGHWHWWLVLFAITAALITVSRMIEQRTGADLDPFLWFLSLPLWNVYDKKQSIYASLRGDRVALRMSGSIDQVLAAWHANPSIMEESQFSWRFFPTAKEAPNRSALATRYALLLREAKAQGFSIPGDPVDE